jgi:hypothetical protein
MADSADASDSANPPLSEAPVKSKKPRTAAQQETFRKAVATLKEKRELDRTEKAQKKASVALERVEKKVVELKSIAKPAPSPAPAAPPALGHVPALMPASPAPSNTFTLDQFEKLLDSKLAKLQKPKRKVVTVELESSEDEYPPPPSPARRSSAVKNSLTALRKAPAVAPQSSQSSHNAWLDSLFPKSGYR